MTQADAIYLPDPLRADVLGFLREAGATLVSNGAPDARGACSGLLVRTTTRVDAALLDSMPALRGVATASVGFDHLDLSALRMRGIPAFYSPGTNRDAAADHTIGLLLATVRHIAAADHSLRAGEWTRDLYVGTELTGKTLGIIGIGRVGSGVARRALAFGMTVVAHDPYVTRDTIHRDVRGTVSLVSLDELLGRSDVVSIHTPLNAETRNILSRARIAQLRPHAVVLNVARGGLLDEDALADALEAGSIAGAALDVFAVEPLPAGSRLRSAPRLVLSPHLGGATTESQIRMQMVAARALVAFLQHGDRRESLTD